MPAHPTKVVTCGACCRSPPRLFAVGVFRAPGVVPGPGIPPHSQTQPQAGSRQDHGDDDEHLREQLRTATHEDDPRRHAKHCRGSKGPPRIGLRRRVFQPPLGSLVHRLANAAPKGALPPHARSRRRTLTSTGAAATGARRGWKGGRCPQFRRRSGHLR